MTGRNRRGSRRAGMTAQIGVAAAVLIGGGAVGLTVVAANNHGPASTVNDAGFIMSFRHHIGEEAALSSALNAWNTSSQASLSTLAQMVPMRTFTQVWGSHHRTMYAAQRGVVVAATSQFLVVKSANGQMHLWWLTTGTKFQNVTASPTGMTAMTGNNMAAAQAVVNQNTVTAQTVVAGSTNAVIQAAAPTKTVVITIVTGNETITITITPTTTTVTQPSATPTATATVTPTATATVTPTATATVTPTATATVTPTATATATTSANSVVAGDLVFVAGVRHHGKLTAELVLFSPPTTMTTTATASATATVRPTVTPTATATATAWPTARATAFPSALLPTGW